MPFAVPARLPVWALPASLSALAVPPLPATRVTVRVIPPVDVLMVLIRTLRGLEGAFPPDTVFPQLLGDPASAGRDGAASTSIFSPSLLPPSLPSVLASSCPFSAEPLSTSISSSSSLGSWTEADGDEEATAGQQDLFVTADVGMEDLGISGSGLSGESRSSITCSGFRSSWGKLFPVPVWTGAESQFC